MHLTTYLQLLHTAEGVLAASYRTVAEGHQGEADVYYTCRRFADDCTGYAQSLDPDDLDVGRPSRARRPRP